MKWEILKRSRGMRRCVLVDLMFFVDISEIGKYNLIKFCIINKYTKGVHYANYLWNCPRGSCDNGKS